MSIYEIVEVINLGLTVAIIIMGIRMLIKSKHVNLELLKAQVFLKEGVIRKMWIYSASAGGFLVIHEIAMASERFSYVEGLSEITMTAFIIAYFLLTYIWYDLLRKSVGK